MVFGSMASPAIIAAGDWKRAHAELSRLARSRAAHDFEEAGWLVVAYSAKTHLMLGFGSFEEYLERVFGWPVRFSREKLRVAKALGDLFEVGQALKDGVVSWSAVREISRVAVAETEADWLDATRGKSMREIEHMVSGRQPGDRPTDPALPDVRRHRLSVEVSAETLALWREAQMAIQKSAGEPLSEDEVVRQIARTVLEGPRDPGRASYQIVVSRCEDCGRIAQRGRGEDLEVSAAVLEAAQCDAQRIDLRQPLPHETVPHKTVPHETVPHETVPHETVPHETALRETAPRATQDVPPATRRQVMLRDQGRCVVPGCRLATFVDVHHLELRSEGGTHNPNKLICLCTAHHHQVHEGRLLIGGTVSTGLLFAHADGTTYGQPPSADRAATFSEAFEALLALGFKQGEAKRTLDHLRATTPETLSAPDLVRRALRPLTQNPRGSTKSPTT